MTPAPVGLCNGCASGRRGTARDTAALRPEQAAAEALAAGRFDELHRAAAALEALHAPPSAAARPPPGT
jgi:hypothetical protein